MWMWCAEPIARHNQPPGLAEHTAIGFWLENSWRSIECEDQGTMGSSQTGWMSHFEWIVINPSHWMPMEPPKGT